MGMIGLTNLNDCLRYTLVPPEKVSSFRLCNPTPIGYIVDVMRTMIHRGNAVRSSVYRERDCMIAHGNSKFLQERLFEQSDKYSVPVCKECGHFATNKTTCEACKTDRVEMIKLPYVSKLVLQELNAMLIKTKISVKE